MTKLNIRRFEAGLSTRRLARESGVPFATVASFMSGRRDINKARIDILIALAETIGVPVDYLLEGELSTRMKATEKTRRKLNEGD